MKKITPTININKLKFDDSGIKKFELYATIIKNKIPKIPN